MKICHVVSTFPRSEKDPSVPWLLETVRRLKEKNLDVVVFAPSYKGLKDHHISDIPIKRFRYFFSKYENLTHDEGMPTKIKKPLYWFIFVFYFIFGYISFRKFQKKEKFDVIHVHWPFPHALWPKKTKKVKIVLTFYAVGLLLLRKFGVLRVFFKKIIKKSDQVITFSCYIKDMLEKEFPETKNKVIINPYGSSIEEKKFGEKANKEKRILFVGRIIERKGIEFLIRAMPKIIGKISAKLIIVGKGDKKEERKLKELAEKFKVGNVIDFKGSVSKKALEKEYQDSDVFVLPAIVDSKGDTEGLGVVMIEALTYKKPVVASNVGGIPDVVINNKTGLLVEEKNPVELSEAIIKVLRNKKLAKKLGNQGYNYVKKKFSWEKTTDNFIKIYKKK